MSPAPILQGLGRWRPRAVFVIAGILVIVVIAGAVLWAVGRFGDASPDDPEAVAVGEPFVIGDFEYVVRAVHAAPTAPGVYLPRDSDGETDPDARALVAEVDVTNVSDTAWLAVTANVLQAPVDAGIVPDANGNADAPAFFTRDGNLMDALNPGVTVHGMFGWVQDRSWDGDELTLRFEGLRWVERDPLTLDDRRWARTGATAYTVDVPVTVIEGEDDE